MHPLPPPEPFPSAETLRGVIDWIAEQYAHGVWVEEVVRARREFDALRGEVGDDEELYSFHLRLFLEWYVRDRPLAGEAPPVIQALRAARLAAVANESALALIAALACSQPGIFVVSTVERAALVLEDLVDGGMFRVTVADDPQGIDAGDVIGTRVVPWAGRVICGPSVCYHPASALAAICAFVARSRANGLPTDRIIGAIAVMRMRFGRFRQIPIEHVYPTSLKRSVSV